MDPLTTESFRARLSEDIKKFHTRNAFDQAVWDELVAASTTCRPASTTSARSRRSRPRSPGSTRKYQAGGNVLFYFATAPRFFGLICEQLHKAGFKDGPGWKRIIVEKPFGTDLASALQLNQDVLAHWHEDQIYRVDHYLGKETVQNLLAFRFTNGMFEPLWNKNYIDNIQFNVVRGRRRRGPRRLLRQLRRAARHDAEPHVPDARLPLHGGRRARSTPDAIRNEKAKLLEAVRVYTPEEVARYVVRGPVRAPGRRAAARSSSPATAQEKDVDPQSKTETFAAARFHIDNWRWEGVPIYLRSGKALWKRGTEIVVEFKKAPQVLFRNTPVQELGANRLIFHIQPYQGIEMQFQAKIPGPTLQLQPVNMRFGYGDAFKASRYTGYEVMIYSCIARRRDAVLARRSRRGRLAGRAAAARRLEGHAGRLPQLRARQLGAEGSVRPHRARRPPLVRGLITTTC